jgi:hypothetical protein
VNALQYHEDAPSFGGGITSTQLHPVVAVAMVLAIVALWVLPRRRMLSVFLCTAFLIPVAQELYVGGAHLFVLRIVILCAWLRLAWAKLFGGEKIVPGGFNALDKAFLLWAVFRASAFVLQYPALGAVTNQIGFFWDVFGAYFLLRYLIQDMEDFRGAMNTIAVVAAIVAVCMLNEKLRDQNVFGFLGGVPLVPGVREGSLRAQGPFSHAILAGCFGATLLPLFFWLWKSGGSKFLAAIGLAASTIITITSASSTPLLTYSAVLLAVCYWPLRKHMRALRWGIVITLVALNFIMKAPVWFLINHVDLVGGNSGYHRAMLIDMFVRHFGDWWLRGTTAASTWGWDMWDLSNQFVAEGESGGLATFVCFIAMICITFSTVGKARKAAEGDRKKEWSMWLLGVAMFAHVVAYFGISYYDHMQILWFTFLAAISVVMASLVAEPVPALDRAGVERGLARASSPRREKKQLAPANNGVRG